MEKSLLSERSVRVKAAFASKDDAIRACGELLLEAGHVEPGYVEAMLERDSLSTTYVGNGVAVPHGTKDSKRFIRSTGLAVIQVPDGVDFLKGNTARLLVGLAALGDEHMDILTEIAMICADDARLAMLLSAETPERILAIIAGTAEG